MKPQQIILLVGFAVRALVMIALLALCLAITVDYALRWWRRRWRTFVPLSAFHDGPANDYELAMLTGGPDLVVLVALLNLESRDALELARTESRSWRPRGSAERPPSIVVSVGWCHLPLNVTERAVYNAVLAGNESEDRVGADPGVLAALDGLRQRLVATGLLDPEPVPTELAGEPWFDCRSAPRTLLGNGLVRRLRRNHPVESVGTLVALFGTGMLAKLDAGLVRARTLEVPRPRSSGFFVPTFFEGDGVEVETGGAC